MEAGLRWKTGPATAIALRSLNFKACKWTSDGKSFSLENSSLGSTDSSFTESQKVGGLYCGNQICRFVVMSVSFESDVGA